MDCPNCTASCSAMKTRVEEEEGRKFGFPKWPQLRDWLGITLPMGAGGQLSSHQHIYAYIYVEIYFFSFLHLLNCLFLNLFLPVFSLSLWERERVNKQLCGCLAAGWAQSAAVGFCHSLVKLLPMLKKSVMPIFLSCTETY